MKKGASGVLPRKILKCNKSGEAISGHFVRAILISVKEHFQRILLSLPFLNITFRKICMSVLVLHVDINVQI